VVHVIRCHVCGGAVWASASLAPLRIEQGISPPNLVQCAKYKLVFGPPALVPQAGSNATGMDLYKA